jgi:hypothetical protein
MSVGKFLIMHGKDATEILDSIREGLSTRESNLSRIVLALLIAVRRLLVACGFYGARQLRSSIPGVSLLKLNRGSSLGEREAIFFSYHRIELSATLYVIVGPGN